VIEYAPEADADVERQHDWLWAVSVRAAEQFMIEIASAESQIESRPLTWRALADGETRRYSFHIHRTSYHLDYRIEPSRIVILRVWHGRQDRPS
jgi:plasmid stabilization system protein ParE